MQKSVVGEWVLKNYARATQYIGLHFENYDDFILTPVIKDEIQYAEPIDLGHITVYLPSYCDHVLLKFLQRYKEFHFEIFSREVTYTTSHDHIKLIPINKKAFNQSLITCTGIITGAGFETPAEAMFLKKKMIAMPIKGQYEQQCNAAALEKLGVQILKRLDENFDKVFFKWINDANPTTITYRHTTESIIECLMMHVNKQAVTDRN
jgi:uncharacterized protein (TIGR00661 family)